MLELNKPIDVFRFSHSRSITPPFNVYVQICHVLLLFLLEFGNWISNNIIE